MPHAEHIRYELTSEGYDRLNSDFTGDILGNEKSMLDTLDRQMTSTGFHLILKAKMTRTQGNKLIVNLLSRGFIKVANIGTLSDYITKGEAIRERESGNISGATPIDVHGVEYRISQGEESRYPINKEYEGPRPEGWREY